MNANDFFFYNRNANILLSAFLKQNERRFNRIYGRRHEIEVPKVNTSDKKAIKTQLIELMSKPDWQSIESRLQSVIITDSNNAVSVSSNSAIQRQDNFTFPIEVWEEILSNISAQIEILADPIDLDDIFEDEDIMSYNPKFSPKSGIRFYGLEVEFNSSDELDEIRENLTSNKLGKVVTDSSCGYEMVSPPWEYDDMLSYIENLPLNKVEVDDRCGIHIHVSRDIFTPLMLGRLLVFVNSFENLKYIEKKVGRGCNRYCAVSYKGDDPTKVKLDSTTRYEAINLTNLSSDKFTIEFRMFASTTDKETIKNYLAWLDTMITLSQTSDLSIDLIESAI